jgi:hypothetical protein
LAVDALGQLIELRRGHRRAMALLIEGPEIAERPKESASDVA